MERSSWTDERLDDMVARIDSSFEQLRAEMAEMRMEMRQGFAGLGQELHAGDAGLRQELHTELRGVSARIDDMRRDMFHGAIAIFGSIVAVFAVLLAQSL